MCNPVETKTTETFLDAFNAYNAMTDSPVTEEEFKLKHACEYECLRKCLEVPGVTEKSIYDLTSYQCDNAGESYRICTVSAHIGILYNGVHMYIRVVNLMKGMFTLILADAPECKGTLLNFDNSAGLANIGKPTANKLAKYASELTRIKKEYEDKVSKLVSAAEAKKAEVLSRFPEAVPTVRDYWWEVEVVRNGLVYRCYIDRMNINEFINFQTTNIQRGVNTIDKFMAFSDNKYSESAADVADWVMQQDDFAERCKYEEYMDTSIAYEYGCTIKTAEKAVEIIKARMARGE